MTVVAASVTEGLMASDKWCMDGGDDTHFDIRKIHRIRGALVGLAGDIEAVNETLAWMRAGHNPKDAPSGNVVALILSSKGLSTWAPGEGLVKVPSAFAIGTGGACARAAMKAGADVRRAVRITCEVHSLCGGGVSVYGLRARP